MNLCEFCSRKEYCVLRDTNVVSCYGYEKIKFDAYGGGGGTAFVKEPDKKETVDHPAHYNQGDIECIDVIEAATIGKVGPEAFCVGNVLKYLWRYEAKNGLEDVKKARWYLDKLISILETKEHETK